MKKIILSVAVATMALSTAAAALEDIKVSGEAKLWYETNNVQTNDLFSQNTGAGSTATGTSGQMAFKLGVTGKQGNVGFGATIYDVSSMGLENTLVVGNRDGGVANGDMYVGEMYITAPVGAKTLLKIGKQELDTPLCFTERWDSVPNTFNGAVAINNSVDNLTLIAAYVGQSSQNSAGTNVSGSNNTLGTPGTLGTAMYGQSVYAAAGLYKANAIAVNVWAYNLNSIAAAYWVDAGMAVAGVDVKAYAAMMDHATLDTTTAYALSGSTKVSDITLFAAGSKVSNKGALPVANVATDFKKTKLPTAGVYADGIYVAQMGSKAFKVKASGKLGTTGVALQAIKNSNNVTVSKETTEFDLILSQKLGDFNFKAILMDRSFDDSATDTAVGGQHVRVIASVNF